MEVYDTAFSIKEKEDHSQLTLADTRSHEIITQGLQSRHPHIPLISEEGQDIPYSERQRWTHFWLVDPLDGTKEFVHRKGEFTVNIALIEKHTPAIGIIFVPVLNVIYVADIKEGCWEIIGDEWRRLHIQDPPQETPVRVVKSRFHASPNIKALLRCLPSYKLVTKGSALKFCAVATGGADFYPRLGPTWEWDTAAGQVIITAAGGVMVDPNGRPLRYNKFNLTNGPFFVASSLSWLKRMGILETASSLNHP